MIRNLLPLLLMLPAIAKAACGASPVSVAIDSAMQQQAYRSCVDAERFYKEQYQLGRSKLQRSLNESPNSYNTELKTMEANQSNGVLDQSLLDSSGTRFLP